jgi:PAS domain S-box-containing protein
MRKKILIVEDERIIAEDIKSALFSFGYDVIDLLTSGEAAIEKIKVVQPDLIMMDIMLDGELDGIHTAEIIRSRSNIPIIYLTAYADESTLARAKLTTPFGYLLKPFEDRELRAAVEVTFYRHDLELKLERSEKRFRSLFEQSNDAVFILNEDGKIDNANERACEMLGYYYEQMIAMQLTSFIPEKWLLQALDKIQNIQETKSLSFETKFRKENGHLLDIDCSLRLITADQKLIQCLARDVTEKKKAEREIFMLYRAIEQSRVSILITDLKGNIVYANQMAAKQTLFSIGELLEKKAQDLNVQKADLEQAWDMLSMGVELSGEYEIRKKNGETYWEYASITPITNPKGQTRNFLIVAEDITDRMNQERTQAELLQNLSEALKEIKDYSHFTIHNMNDALTEIEISLQEMENKPAEYASIIEKIDVVKMMLNGMREFSESIVTDTELG